NAIYAATYLVYLVVYFTKGYSHTLDLICTYEQIILALTIPITFFISLKYYKNNKVLTYVVLPVQSTWSICWGTAIYGLVFKVSIFPVLQANWYGFETILLISLVRSFSWILLQRFGELKKQI